MKIVRVVALLLTCLVAPQSALAVFNQIAPVFRYTDLNNGQVAMETGTLYLNGQFVPSSTSVQISAAEFGPNVLLAVSGKVVTALVVYSGFKSIVSPKFRRSVETYSISGAPYVVMSVSGIKPPRPKVSIAAIVPESTEDGSPSGEFMFTLDSPVAQDVTLRFGISGSARKNKDYQGFSGKLKIPAGNVSGVIEVIPIDDKNKEKTETVTATLIAAKSYRFGPSKRATVKINDND